MGAISPHLLKLRVYYEDTDSGGVVYYANYLRFIERGRTEWLRSLGCEQDRLLREEGLAFAVRSLTADYLKPARLDDELIVSTRIEKLGRAQVVFAQQLLRGDEELFRATVQVACIDAKAMKPVAIPASIRNPLVATTP